MAGKKRKGRAHRARGAATARRKARQGQAASLGQIRLSPDPQASPARLLSGNGAERPKLPRARREAGELAPAGATPLTTKTPRFGRLGRIPTALLPGQTFFAMGRPVPGLVCCVLQATLLGWLPAALWALRAERRVAEKQRGLAARLRPL